MTTAATGPADPLARQAAVLGQGPRIAPLAPEERTPEQQALIDRLKPPPQVAAMKGAGDTQWAEILAHHPALSMAHMGLAQQFMASPKLSPRTRELAVLRLGWISGAPFEWGGHVTIAKACGVSAQEIERVIAGPDAAGWTAHEAALLRATDELHADSMITDPTWAALAEGLDAAQLIEFIMLIGQYKTVAFYQNALRFSLPEGNDGLLAR